MISSWVAVQIGSTQLDVAVAQSGGTWVCTRNVVGLPIHIRALRMVDLRMDASRWSCCAAPPGGERCVGKVRRNAAAPGIICNIRVWSVV